MPKVTRTALPLAITAAAILLVPGIGAAANKPVPIAGKWAGKVTDSGVDGSTYKAKISVKDKLVKGRSGGAVDYPRYDCGGELVYLRHRGGKYFFDEKLKYGQDACIDGGVMRLKRAGGKLSYLWTDPNGDYTTSGKLRSRH